MATPDFVRVATYQAEVATTLAIRDLPESRLLTIRAVACEAEQKGVEVLVFQECFLTGYFDNKNAAWASSLTTDGHIFAALCAITQDLSVTLIVGFNEQRGEELYNAAAVVERGRCLGIYRKSYLYHSYHTAGRDYPVFQKRGVTYGVVICLDATYQEPSRILAGFGARVLFCPMDNRVLPDNKYAERQVHYNHIAERSRENNCWFVSADVAHVFDGDVVCPGHTVIYNSRGLEVCRSLAFTPSLVTYDIPRQDLLSERVKRLGGTAPRYRGERDL
jgi:predicted amidohydrolase